MTRPYCRICGAADVACGDDHMTRPPISSRTIKGEDMAAEPQELKEYEYVVGHLPVTARLTEKMAQRLNAKPVGTTESPGTGNVENNEAQRASTAGREADDAGVSNPESEEAATKARTARNKRAG